MKQKKTVAIRLLEGQQVPYAAFEYDKGLTDAAAVAAHLGVPANQVFKTLVARPAEGKPLLVMVPAGQRLDLKKVAGALGVKKVRMASQREAEAMTGLQVGGISALALLNRGFVMLLDQSAVEQQEIYVSGGRRGLQLRLPVSDLSRVTEARLVEAT